MCLCACVSPTPVCLVCLCALARFGPRTINIVIETYMRIKAYQVYIYIRFTKQSILSASSIFNLEGPIRWRMGWPRVAGRGGPATRVRAYDDVYVVLSNTMFYVDRLHKLVAAQCACCSDLLGNAMRLFSTWVPGYPKKARHQKIA